MIFHENRLLADDSRVISCPNCFSKIRKDDANLSSAAVVIGALRVNTVNYNTLRLTEALYIC